MKKRIIYFILILIIVMLHIPITSSAESLTEIQLNANLITDDCLNPIRSDITEPEQTKYFRFMPLETGDYTFEVICNEKIVSKLYHKSIGKIDEFASDEVVGNSFDVFLVADEEYYFSVNFKDSVAIGQFTVRMHKHIDMFLCPKCNENYSSTYFPWQIGNNVAYVHDNTSGKIMLYGKGETWGELPLWQISDGYYIEIVEVLDGVTLISSSFFSNQKEVTTVVLPKSMKEIGDDAFVGCDNIADVWYYGTEQDKIRIDFNSGNENLINATWHYNDAFQEPHIHSFANYVYNNDATYDADGTKTATCVCGEKDTITAIGTKLHRHSFANYSYNNDATYDADGTKTGVCTCGEKETVTAAGTKLPLLDSSKLFSDVAASAWYKPYTDYAVSYKIFNGSGDKMNPDANITRAEFVQVLANLSGVNTADKNIHAGFKDVKVGEWYAPAIKWASTNGIVYGVGDGKFEPDANITREQMCTMLVRYIQSYLKKDVKLVNSQKSFADHAHISDWAIEPVYLCQQAGLVYGISETEFAPGESADRASVATLMTRFHQNYLK